MKKISIATLAVAALLMGAAQAGITMDNNVEHGHGDTQEYLKKIRPASLKQ